MDMKKWGSVFKYLFVGGSSALLELVLFNLLITMTALSLPVANVTAVAVATVYNYILNKRWSFDSKTWSVRSALLYGALFVFNTAFSSIFITLVSSLGVLPVLAKMVSMCCIVIWNYFLYRNVVFK